MQIWICLFEIIRIIGDNFGVILQFIKTYKVITLKSNINIEVTSKVG